MVSMTTKVFLLDDHEIVRRGLRDLLEAEEDLTVVGEATTAEQALNRIPATQPDVAVLAGLSDQERKFLDRIAEGYTNRQIANPIFLAETPVKAYVSSLPAKLRMSRRTEAAAYAARLTERRKQEPR